MKIARKRKKQAIQVPVTAMGDIAFLLIIFFMLASQFAKESKIKIERPQARGLSELDKSQVWVSMEADGAIYIDGEEASVAEIKARVEGLLEGREDKKVLVKIDKTATKKHYESLMIELSLAGATLSLVGDEQPQSF